MLQPLERPLEYRPPLKLALVESHGTEATIAVMGAPAGADIFPAAPPAADAPERDANLGA